MSTWTKCQSFATTVDGGAGTNSLTISYVTGLGDFVTRSLIGETWHFVDANGGTIDVTNVLVHATDGNQWWSGSLTAGSKTYSLVDDLRGDTTPFSGAYGSVRAFVYQSGNSVEVAMVDGGKFLPQYRMSGFGGFSLNGSESYTVYGSSGKDIVFTGYGADTITTGDGNDFVFGGGGRDTIRTGAGDDVVYLSQTALTDDAVIDGGSGSNTLAFIKPGEAGGWDNDSYGAITINMSSLGVAINFQNIVGSANADTITGDSQNNVLIGNSGNDTIDGGAGDDILYGDANESDTSGNVYGLNSYWSSSQGDDTLRGGLGNDQLFGGGGNDLLDGGKGADRLTGGAGIDTFVLRAGDGGSTIADADTITDFNASYDLLQLSGFTRSQLSITLQSGNSVIKFGSEFIAVVVGVAPSQLIDSVFTT